MTDRALLRAGGGVGVGALEEETTDVWRVVGDADVDVTEDAEGFWLGRLHAPNGLNTDRAFNDSGTTSWLADAI
jgi:hypothetical protein